MKSIAARYVRMDVERLAAGPVLARAPDRSAVFRRVAGALVPVRPIGIYVITNDRFRQYARTGELVAERPAAAT